MAGIQGTTGGFDTGKQCTLVLIGPGATPGSTARVDLPNITGFDCKQVTVNVKVDKLDGIQLNAELPKGWTGSFDLERGSSAVDDLFATIEDRWLNGGSYTAGTIYQYVDEADGSASTYQFDNVALKLDEAGNWKSDQSVKQRISFAANRRRRI